MNLLDPIVSPHPPVITSKAGTAPESQSRLLAEDDPIAALHASRVMMVDDDPVLVDVIQSTLEEVGYANFTSTTAPGGALRMMKEIRPDVLLLDVVMPDIDGLTLLEMIAADTELKRTPVIVLTASSEPGVKLRALELGAADFLAKPVDPSELVLRVRNTLAAKAYRDRLAYVDSVTGLPNRRLLLDRLDWSFRYAHRYGKRGALLHIDIDRFKQINEAFGPRSGDMLLKQIGERVLRSVRAADAVARLGSDEAMPTVSRLGGDEFTVLLPDISAAENAAGIAQRILEAIQSTPFYEGDQELFLAASIGGAIFPDDGADVDALLRNAGSALNQCKLDGGKICRFYSQEFNARAVRRITLETDLRRAIEREEFQLYFQPKVEANDRSVCGAEVLLRWKHPVHGFVSPAEFIPIAEATGLIGPLGAWVLEQTCINIARWRDAGLKPVPVSINVSALQLNESGFAASVQRRLSAAGLTGDAVCIELTETVILDYSAATLQTLNDLGALGIKLSIDDFGAGYTSLAHLKGLPFQELKIDRSFVNDIERDSGCVAIVAAVIALAHALGMTVVAEGVETNEQHAVLSARGCDECQGYYFARPMPVDDFERSLRLRAGTGASDFVI